MARKPITRNPITPPVFRHTVKNITARTTLHFGDGRRLLPGQTMTLEGADHNTAAVFIAAGLAE